MEHERSNFFFFSLISGLKCYSLTWIDSVSEYCFAHSEEFDLKSKLTLLKLKIIAAKYVSGVGSPYETYILVMPAFHMQSVPDGYTQAWPFTLDEYCDLLRNTANYCKYNVCWHIIWYSIVLFSKDAINNLDQRIYQRIQKK